MHSPPRQKQKPKSKRHSVPANNYRHAIVKCECLCATVEGGSSQIILRGMPLVAVSRVFFVLIQLLS